MVLGPAIQRAGKPQRPSSAPEKSGSSFGDACRERRAHRRPASAPCPQTVGGAKHGFPAIQSVPCPGGAANGELATTHFIRTLSCTAQCYVRSQEGCRGVRPGGHTDRWAAAVGYSRSATSASMRGCWRAATWRRVNPTWMAGGTLPSLNELCTGSIAPICRPDWPLERSWLAWKADFQPQRSRTRQVARSALRPATILPDMLDRNMQYTCAYWKDATTLDEAQENKLRLICRKLQLQPGMTVLELGGGFCGLAHFMASEYGCRVVTYNISAAQVAYGREVSRACRSGSSRRTTGRPQRKRDFRPRRFGGSLRTHRPEELSRTFCTGAPAVEPRRPVPAAYDRRQRVLQRATDPWIDKYIFPNGMTPSVAQLGRAMEGSWVVEDWHNFGPDYDKTLLAWWHRLRPRLASLQAKYGDRFYRMWKYYLLGCAGGIPCAQAAALAACLIEGRHPVLHARQVIREAG